MIDVVAAGVIDGKIVTDASCMVPASSSRCNVGSRPVRIAGQTTRGVAASMTMSRTLAGILFELTIRGARTGSIRFPRPAFAAARLGGQLQTSICRRIERATSGTRFDLAPPRGRHGTTDPGSPLRPPQLRPAAGLRADGDSRAGARHWREHRGLQRRLRRAVEAPAISRNPTRWSTFTIRIPP